MQIESRLSLTGSNADRRLRVAPGEIGHLATHLAAKIAQRAGTPFATPGLAPTPSDAALEAIADRLWTARGRGLVVSGSQDVRVQALCNFINQTIGAYGATVDLARPSLSARGQRQPARRAASRAFARRRGRADRRRRQPGLRPAGRGDVDERHQAGAAAS